MTEKAKEKILNEDITITPKAAKRVKLILEGEGKVGYGLRISVEGGGCSGMNYNMSFDTLSVVYKSNGIDLYCDSKIMALC